MLLTGRVRWINENVVYEDIEFIASLANEQAIEDLLFPSYEIQHPVPQLPSKNPTTPRTFL
jgi:hypothetical protein